MRKDDLIRICHMLLKLLQITEQRPFVEKKICRVGPRTWESNTHLSLFFILTGS